MKKISVLGVCAAQGALLFPFKDLEKFEIVGNLELRGVFHTPKEEQWKSNFGDIPFFKDLEPFHRKFQGEYPKIIVGSPSCGHSSVFSYSRKKTLGKPKEDKTLNCFIDQIKEFQPRIWAMENLPKLLEMIPLDEWQKVFPNYHFIAHCYSVLDFGNSQASRKRLILIGIKKGLSNKWKNIAKEFTKVYQVNEPRKFGELYKSIRKKLNYREHPDKVLAMYDSRKLPEKKNLTVEQVRILWRTDFKNEYKWPMPGTKMNTLPGVYRNRKNAYPMTARPSSRQFNHKGKIMGLEEYRVIMGFPESFKVYMPNTKRGSKTYNYWLNKGRNTLTKGSTYEMGKWFSQCCEKAL